MNSIIQRLDSKTSKSIQASLLFPTLTHIILELVYNALAAKPTSRIRLSIHLAPEWQITCEDDAMGHDGTASTFFHVAESSSVENLGYLGIVDVQYGRKKLVRKGDRVIFSGALDDDLVDTSASGTVFTLRDLFRELPVRRHALSSENGIHSELEKCRKALAIIFIAHNNLHFHINVKTLEQADYRTLLDIPKAMSYLRRYEDLFSIPVANPDFALPISDKRAFRIATLKVQGFLILSLLPSRAHQQILINGRIEAESEVSSSLKDVVMQSLQETYLASWQTSQRKVVQGSDCKSVEKYFGYYLDISLSNEGALDRSQIEESFREILRGALRSKGLLLEIRSEQQTSPAKRGNYAAGYQSPTKKLRSSQGSLARPIDRSTSRHFKLDRAGLLREPRQSNDEDERSSWLHDILRDWKRTTTNDQLLQCCIPALGGENSTKRASSTPTAFGEWDNVQSHSLEKRKLKSCRVIGQVDSKFISVLYDDDILVFVDQHAAHERVRLEASLNQYLADCLAGLPGQSLSQDSKGISISLPSGLAKSFEEEHTRAGLSFWGFQLRTEGKDLQVILVDSVPTVLYERLVSSRESLIEFFTKLAVALEDGGICRRLLPSLNSREEARKEGSGWTLTLRHLPEAILEIFYSMSCRGAIMFNDVLTPLQCEKLISQLATTTFPFQCAHGRPSMAPICNLPASKSSPFLSSTTSSSSSIINWEALL